MKKTKRHTLESANNKPENTKVIITETIRV